MRSKTSLDRGLLDVVPPHHSKQISKHKQSKGRSIASGFCVILFIIFVGTLLRLVIGAWMHTKEGSVDLFSNPYVAHMRRELRDRVTLFTGVSPPVPIFTKYSSPFFHPTSNVTTPTPLTAFELPSANLDVNTTTLAEICKQSEYVTLCTELFASIPLNAVVRKGHTEQWTIIAMKSAEGAIKELYQSVLVSMKKFDYRGIDIALQQCREVLWDSLDELKIAIKILSEVDKIRFRSFALAGVETYMNAARLDMAICHQHIIGEVGSDSSVGAQVDHAIELLSIVSTFVKSNSNI